MRVAHPEALDTTELRAAERHLVNVRKRESTPELVPKARVQRIQDEGQEIPVRRDHHLRASVTRHHGSHDSERSDLSLHVRLAPTRRLGRKTPRLPNQR